MRKKGECFTSMWVQSLDDDTTAYTSHIYDGMHIYHGMQRCLLKGRAPESVHRCMYSWAHATGRVYWVYKLEFSKGLRNLPLVNTIFGWNLWHSEQVCVTKQIISFASQNYQYEKKHSLPGVTYHGYYAVCNALVDDVVVVPDPVTVDDIDRPGWQNTWPGEGEAVHGWLWRRKYRVTRRRRVRRAPVAEVHTENLSVYLVHTWVLYVCT